MKRPILALAIVVALCSCASLPEPESPGNSLVIGSLVLDFPDGFFASSPRTLTNAVTLGFRNQTTGRSFSLSTESPGFFCFLTNGTDEYVFENFSYADTSGRHSYGIGKTSINLKIATTPDRIIYLGHLTITYAKPTLVATTGEANRSFDFKISSHLDWDRDGVLSYIARKNPKSEWLACEILDFKRK